MKSERRRLYLARLICVLALFSITLLSYRGTLKNGFVYDDHFQIEQNEWIRSAESLPKIFTSHVYGFSNVATTNSYRPFLNVIYMAEHSLFGLNPWGYHLVNASIHALNGILVFMLASALIRRSGIEGQKTSVFPPFLAAALFVLHPLHSEAVSWAACVTELSFTFFYLLSLYVCLNTRNILLPAFLYLAALFSKETAVTLPAVVIAYDFITGGFKSVRRNLLRYMAFGAALVLYILLRFNALGGAVPNPGLNNYLSFFQVILNSAAFLAGYIRSLVFPTEFYPFRIFSPLLSIAEPKAAASVIFIASAAMIVFVLRKKINRTAVFSMAFFLIALSPALYIPGLSTNAFADRQAYLASVGLVLSAAIFFQYIYLNRKKTFSVILFSAPVILGLFSYEVMKRTEAWRDDLSVWSASAKAAPTENYLAFLNMGVEYSIRGDLDRAQAAFIESIRINKARYKPNTVYLSNAHLRLGNIYREKGALGDAAREYIESLNLRPDPAVFYKLAAAYKDAGLCKEALSAYSETLKFRLELRDLKDVYNNMGNCYSQEGLYAEAFSSYQEALKASPGDSATMENLKSLQKLGFK